jgi:hypothetical protein
MDANEAYRLMGKLKAFQGWREAPIEKLLEGVHETSGCLSFFSSREI